MFAANVMGAGPSVVTGQVVYGPTAGTSTWVCPAGVTSVSVVCVGCGASPPDDRYYGGVGLLGAGTSGAAGYGNPGSGGVGDLYGGGRAPGNYTNYGGAVRIIWPGNFRMFPSTRTGNE